MRNSRSGLTLVEVIVAILLFGIGSLGLAAVSASITRQMTASLMRSRSALAARSRDEIAHSRPCSTLSSGSLMRDGLRQAWVTQAGPAATLEQSIERASVPGLATDRFLSAMPCD